jgi:three-Cys-motif partner protein
MKQKFGGKWTELKLDCVRRYLDAYRQVMKKQRHLKTHYIDAFAGTGYVELRTHVGQANSLFAEFEQVERESQILLQGSAEQALEVQPPFESFTFIEESQWRARELEQLRHRYPAYSTSMRIIRGDANRELQRLSARWNRTRDRAVLFLDPFGISVEWATLEAVASTQSIDVWYLFPIMAVNRLLPKDRDPLDIWEQRLNTAFGTENWRESFYVRKQERTLLDTLEEKQGSAEVITKIGDWDGIRDFLLARLRTIFSSVAENPLFLKNSTGSPMFLLCFAASNPRGTAGQIALRIANHILKAK